MHLVTWKTKYLGAWNIRYLGTWNTRYIWGPGTPCVLFPEDQRLGRLPVSSLLSTLFHMSCMTLESDKMFHKLKTNLRRKIRTMLMRKGWSTLGRVFLEKRDSHKVQYIYSDGDDHRDGCEPRLS